MKTKISSVCWLLALAGTTLPLCASAQAQNTVASSVPGRLSVVELRDVTLADALEMIFQAAGNPSHIIDEQAQTVPIPSITLNNIAWDAAVRNLTQLNGYKVSRNPSGTYIIEPRVIQPADGEFFPGSEGSMPSRNSGSPFPGGVPSNPFTRNGFRSRTQSNPSLRTSSNAQTRPNFGGAGGQNTANSKEGKDYKVIIVRHIYAGGLAQLFNQSSVIKTEDFVSPGVTQNSGGGQNGGQGGFGGGIGGQGGGFGGGIGGIGGQGGGFGGIGGGFGGQGGGFGGGIGGQNGGGFGGGFGF